MLLISAILYGIAFVAPNVFWWGTPLAFLLCVHQVLFGYLSLSQGILWGSIAYGIHLFPLFFSLACIARSSALYCAWALMTAYCSFHVGVLFWFIGRSRNLWNSLMGRIIVTAGSLFFLIIWFDTALLWIFGVREGYPFFHPLLPLMVEPRLFFLLPFVGLWGMTFLFIITLIFLAYCWRNRSCTGLFFFVVFCGVIWGLGFALVDEDCEAPDWIDGVGIVSPSYIPNHPCSPLKLGQELCSAIVALQNRGCSLKTVMMPESSVSLYGKECAQAISILGENNRDVRLIFGGYCDVDSVSYNSCYCIDRGVMKRRYDKTHGIPFVERMPFWLHCSLTCSWFLGDKEPFVQADDCPVQFEIVSGIFMRPLLCSELFFTNLFCKSPEDSFFVLVNDAWFQLSSMPYLLWLLAQLKVRMARKSLLYVSYSRSYFLDHRGRFWKLCRV